VATIETRMVTRSRRNVIKCGGKKKRRLLFADNQNAALCSPNGSGDARPPLRRGGQEHGKGIGERRSEMARPRILRILSNRGRFPGTHSHNG
jgi:hypothetical protein